MTQALADTYYWLALLNVNDPAHPKAVQAALPDQLVVTWAIQLEVMDALCVQKVRHLAMHFWHAIHGRPDIDLIPLDEHLLGRAVALFASRRDKDWSLTDCISFVVMQDRHITDALTADRHFEQAGFRTLLR